MPDHLDALDPRFPIHLAPQSPAFWDALRLWECYPSHPAQAFARDEAAHAVELNAREETTFIRPVHDRLVWALPAGTPDDDDEAQFVQVPMSQLVEDERGALRAPPPVAPPVPYPQLEPDTLAHDFTLTGPLELLP